MRHRVEIKPNEHQFYVESNETILDAALRQGINLDVVMVPAVPVREKYYREIYAIMKSQLVYPMMIKQPIGHCSVPLSLRLIWSLKSKKSIWVKP